MHWKLKATIQNLVSYLPAGWSYRAYYWLQRHFGGLRNFHPGSRLTAGVEIWQQLEAQGETPAGKRFFEVGTGRVPLAPLAFWLMGAAQTITVDLNPYLSDELLRDSLLYLATHQAESRRLFGNRLDGQRFADLLAFSRDARFSRAGFLELCNIRYVAPGDAAHTDLAPQSIDYHSSYWVFEHIPPNVLRDILQEGNRILRPDGLCVHRIDYSDHFSHSDPRISAINFLQYSQPRWDRYAGNRYMYMNRLRHDDFLDLFQSVGHRVVAAAPDLDRGLLEFVQRGELQLDPQFADKSPDVLAMTGAWVLSQPAGGAATG